MKRIIMIAALLLGAMTMRAQDCNEIVLALYGGDTVRLLNSPEEKILWHCQYAQNAFYYSDGIPSGAEEKSLSEVTSRTSGAVITQQEALNSPNYYAYTFKELQLEYQSTQVTLCFATGDSQHPYLVLRSLTDIYRMTEYPEEYSN